LTPAGIGKSGAVGVGDPAVSVPAFAEPASAEPEPAAGVAEPAFASSDFA